MSSSTRAFGRALPPDLIDPRSSSPTPTQLWKTNEEKSGKSGPCHSVYWVRPSSSSSPSSISSSSSSSSSASASSARAWTGGSVYKGEWLANERCGYGVQLWPSGNKYEGDWAKGKREGHGVMWINEKSAAVEGGGSDKFAKPRSGAKDDANANGKALRRVYAGNWSNDLKDGLGVYFYADQSRYEGEWKAGVRSGRGTLYSAPSKPSSTSSISTNPSSSSSISSPSSASSEAVGDTYTGSWLLGSQSGFGTLSLANGDIFEGEFSRGLREGPGLYYFKNKGKVYDGEWVNGAPQCGVYCDANEFFDEGGDKVPANDEVAEAGGQRRMMKRRPAGALPPIPRLRMADADGVLALTLERVSQSRDAARNLHLTDLEALFGSEAMDAMRRLFAQYENDPSTALASSSGAGSGREGAYEYGSQSKVASGQPKGRLDLKHLYAMLASLGLPPLSNAERADLAMDLRKSTNTPASGGGGGGGGETNSTFDFSEFVQAVHLREEARNVRRDREREQEGEEIE